MASLQGPGQMGEGHKETCEPGRLEDQVRRGLCLWPGYRRLSSTSACPAPHLLVSTLTHGKACDGGWVSPERTSVLRRPCCVCL